MSYYKEKEDTNDYIQLFEEGEKLYRVGKIGIEEIIITSVRKYPHFVYRDDKGHSYFNHSIIRTCFRTLEEAEKEVLRRQNIRKKRDLLRQYELELNEKFNLGDHFTVK